MKLLMDILFLIISGYYCYKFVQLLIKMKQKIILPATNEEIKAIRKYPQKTVGYPTISKQKTGIIMYAVMLLYVIVMLLLGVFIMESKWSLSFYFLVFLPLIHSHNLLNLFAIVGDGVLIGNRFIAWRKIKTFKFVTIDINHKYYGASKEINGAYELKIREKFHCMSCIVTTNEMKKKLNKALRENVSVNETV